MAIRNRFSLLFLLVISVAVPRSPAAAAYPAQRGGASNPAGEIRIRAIGRVRIISPRGHRPLYSPENIEKFLGRFTGKKWNLADLAARLEGKYLYLGYTPEVELRDREGILYVTIRETRFVLSLITRNPDDLDRIGVSSRKPRSPTGQAEERIPEWILRQNLLSAEGDGQNLGRYLQDRFRLAPFGHRIAFIEGGRLPGSEISSSAYLLIPRGSLGHDSPPIGEEKPPPDTNYLGGSLDFGPRRGFTMRAVYRKWRWLTPFDSLEVSPTLVGGSGGGNLSYRSNYLFYDRGIRRNLSVQFNLYSDLYPDRPFGGIEIDERRSGGEVSLGVEILPEKNKHDLTTRFEIERTRVTLDPAPPMGILEDFSFFRITSRYVYHHQYRSPSFRFRATPSLAWALEELGGDLSYFVGTLDSDFHGFLRRRWEIDFHLRGGTIDRTVPLTEELRMGGVQTVRGFKEDDFSGRRVVSLQSEVWFPLTTTSAGGSRFLRSLKGALFLDVGSIAGGAIDPPESVLGLGTGVRFQVPRNPLLVKIDYAWGFLHGHSDSFAYLSLALLY